MSEQEVEARFSYAGFWIRLVAMMIDTILLCFIIYPLLFYIYGMSLVTSTKIVHGPAEVLLSYVFPAVACIVFWRTKSSTPGKMIFGLKIVDAKTGGKPSSGQCFIRYFGYLASMLPLCLGFLWIAFDARKQSFHDKLAGTVVVWSQPGADATPVEHLP